MPSEAGTLYLVPTPIGNYDDITLRAVKVLSAVPFVICESFKETARLLNHLGITKELLRLDEHTEENGTDDIIALLKKGNDMALVSDCGTPVFSDPGRTLVHQCIQLKIKIVPLPGANSILPAVIASGFPIEPFTFYGWLSPKKEIRAKELLSLKHQKGTIIIMETPYRLQRILEDVSKAFHPSAQGVIAFEISTPAEKFYRGTLSHLAELSITKNLKGEFVLIIYNGDARR